MANVLVEEQSLQDIANAIRSKNGTQDTYTPSQMATAINDIQSGQCGQLEKIPITVSPSQISPHFNPSCQYTCNGVVYDGSNQRNVDIISKQGETLSYSMQCDGYLIKTDSILISGDSVLLIPSNFQKDTNFNGEQIFRFDFSKEDMNYSNYGIADFSNFNRQHRASSGYETFSANNYIDISLSIPSLQTYTNPCFVFEAIVLFNSTDASTYSTLYSMGGSRSSNGAFLLNPNYISLWVNNNRVYIIKITDYGGNIQSGVHHFCCVATPTSTIFYIDGVKISTQNNSILYSGFQYTSPRIGTNNSNMSSYFRGRLYNLSLCVRDIADPSIVDNIDFLLNV